MIARIISLAALVVVCSGQNLGMDGHGQMMTRPKTHGPGPGPDPGPPQPGPGPHPFPPGPGPHPGPPGPPRPENVCRDDFMRFCAFRVPDMKNMEQVQPPAIMQKSFHHFALGAQAWLTHVCAHPDRHLHEDPRGRAQPRVQGTC